MAFHARFDRIFGALSRSRRRCVYDRDVHAEHHGVLDPALGWRHRANLHRTYYTEGVAARVQTFEHGLRTPLPKPTITARAC
jgi:hypothetical protein